MSSYAPIMTIIGQHRYPKSVASYLKIQYWHWFIEKIHVNSVYLSYNLLSVSIIK